MDHTEKIPLLARTSPSALFTFNLAGGKVGRSTVYELVVQLREGYQSLTRGDADAIIELADLLKELRGEK